MRWVIGDVHGMLVPLEGLLQAIEARDAAARFYFVGDYVNRGPASRGVIDRLVALGTAGRARFARGNHDDVLDVILNGRGYAGVPEDGDPVAAYTWFINFGLDWTLHSYGVDIADIERVTRAPSREAIQSLFEPVPAAHREFLRRLPPVIDDEPDLFVAHAMWGPGDPDTDFTEQLTNRPTLRNKIIWGRYGPEIMERKRWARTGYFGHTPVEHFPLSVTKARNEPIRGPSIVLLDTASALVPHGRLSAVCHESGELIQVDRAGRPIEPE